MQHNNSSQVLPNSALRRFVYIAVILSTVMAAWGQVCRITGRAGATALRSQGLPKFNGQMLDTHSHQVRSMASGALRRNLGLLFQQLVTDWEDLLQLVIMVTK